MSNGHFSCISFPLLIEAYLQSKLKTEKMPKIFQIFKDDFSLLNNFQARVHPLEFEFLHKIKAFD